MMNPIEKKVPELRFPEFDEKWELNTIENKFYLISGQHFNPDEYTTSQNSDLIPYFTGPSDFTNSDVQIAKWSLKKGKEAKKGDILITVKGNGVGTTMLLNLDKVTMGRQVMAIGSKKSSTEFLFHKLSRYKNYFVALASGNMIPGLSRKDILSLKSYFPSFDEQQKIADFLSVVDERIQQLTRKKELLEQYKKGIMQQIFSQEIRFKNDNGVDFPDWENKRLGEISKKISDKNNSNAVVNVLSNSAINGIVNQIDFFNKEIANQNNLDNYYIVQKNDFVYNPRISKYAPVGPIKRNNIGKGVMSPLYTIFRFNDDLHSYFEYYFESSIWHKYLYSVANFGARFDRMNISTSDFFKMPIQLPCELERKKIENFFYSINKKIELVDIQLNRTQDWKKGLLQKIFV